MCVGIVTLRSTLNDNGQIRYEPKRAENAGSNGKSNEEKGGSGKERWGEEVKFKKREMGTKGKVEVA